MIHVIHDMDGKRIAEYLFDEFAGTSTLIREYLWMGDMVVDVIEDGQIYYVRTDHIGRPAFVTDQNGTVVWETTYLPFGGVRTSSGPNHELRFPGQWFQSETGLHQNWIRHYDQTTGRHMRADPLGFLAGQNLYTYALNNPHRYIDPDDRAPQALVYPAVACARNPALCREAR